MFVEATKGRKKRDLNRRLSDRESEECDEVLLKAGRQRKAHVVFGTADGVQQSKVDNIGS